MDRNSPYLAVPEYHTDGRRLLTYEERWGVKAFRYFGWEGSWYISQHNWDNRGSAPIINCPTWTYEIRDGRLYRDPGPTEACETAQGFEERQTQILTSVSAVRRPDIIFPVKWYKWGGGAYGGAGGCTDAGDGGCIPAATWSKVIDQSPLNDPWVSPPKGDLNIQLFTHITGYGLFASIAFYWAFAYRWFEPDSWVHVL